ncbi:transglycosylase SLT domain-containing protein [Endozoicomonas sp. SM1973]|uniref:Transglycosylase SLT domain-containing protein n=1 Tax=Spartinivicinus marinus TaxID=2994442 RepID=A0A853IBZ0_9GAMM|nr:transglycosylase SLT domain-containing protein [Spartinivicinus marinus]MCX4029747.1 transglycosylase SLT domain-containing protein [Spartinivicinus marinus]NYZ68078.1 transglycosylase SLT domain-containing protein [Spartinivicinus marinus]
MKMQTIAPKALTLCISLLGATWWPTVSANVPNQYEQERQLYQKALKALNKHDWKQFNQYQNKLTHYPLYPYLEYYELQRKLSVSPSKEINAFIKTYNDLPVTARLQQNWLRYLAKNKQWKTFKANYDPKKATVDLQCWYHRAQLATGQTKQAFQGAKQLWLSGKSQPEACDPLFARWRSAGQLTQNLAWQRMSLAYEERNPGLGKYLSRFLNKANKPSGKLFYSTYRNPQKLFKSSRYQRNTPFMRDIIKTGLMQMARRNPQEALNLWKQYSRSHSFSASQSRDINQYISLYLLKHFAADEIQWVDQVASKQPDQELVEWRLRIALKTQDWPSVKRAYKLLPTEQQQEPRWRYWNIRAQEALAKTSKAKKQVIKQYAELAKERDFYAFLAADRVQVPYRLNHQPYPVSTQTKNKIKSLGGIKRAAEFYRLNHVMSARREWHHLSKILSSEELIAAAEIAYNWKRYDQSIFNSARAKYWDDLQLRFPLAFKRPILSISEKNQLSSSWVYAIARQESAFMYDARSHAGAMGLMQLMPATARHVARKNGFRYRGTKELLNPRKNIQLGTAYLVELMKTFNGNRILATAAYNAGPHRVKQWLKRSDNLPYDIWIESIPFNETRKYVQNVLAYQVIYSNKLGKSKTTVVTPKEKNYLYVWNKS